MWRMQLSARRVVIVAVVVMVVMVMVVVVVVVGMFERETRDVRSDPHPLVFDP